MIIRFSNIEVNVIKEALNHKLSDIQRNKEILKNDKSGFYDLACKQEKYMQDLLIRFDNHNPGE
jgi:hypothetical protein